MNVVTRSARIVDPIYFDDSHGQRNAIPVGPCLIEPLGPQSVEIFWGNTGEESAVLPLDEVEVAESSGKLVLLD